MGILGTVKIYLDLYKIEETINLDSHGCFSSNAIYPEFQEHLVEFKNLLISFVENNQSKTFYHFSENDYMFLKEKYKNDNINELLLENFLLCDYYTCQIYPELRSKFNEIIKRKDINFPSEYGNGLIANKWILKTFSGKIGIIGDEKKVNIIKNLMEYSQYQEYLELEKFEDYISIPNKFDSKNLEKIEKTILKQLKKSSSKIFIVDIGVLKSDLLHKLKMYTDAVFLNIEDSIDALSGLINFEKPFFGDWVNYQIDETSLYKNLDYKSCRENGDYVLLPKPNKE